MADERSDVGWVRLVDWAKSRGFDAEWLLDAAIQHRQALHVRAAKWLVEWGDWVRASSPPLPPGPAAPFVSDKWYSRGAVPASGYVIVWPEDLRKVLKNKTASICYVGGPLSTEFASQDDSRLKTGMLREPASHDVSIRGLILAPAVQRYFDQLFGTDASGVATVAQGGLEPAQALLLAELFAGTHPRTAPELRAALKVWLEVVAPAEKTVTRRQMKECVRKWLDSGALGGCDSKESRERVATLAVPERRKKGGSPEQ